MKTKIKRHSRTALSILLSVCMLVSCLTVGIIATDAAKSTEERVGAIDDSEAIGWNTPMKIRANVNNWGTQAMTEGTDNQWSYNYYFTHNQNYNLYFNFVDNTGNWVGPSDGNNTTIDTSNNEKSTAANSNVFKYQSSWLSGTTAWRKVVIQFKNDGSGKAWYWTSDLSDFSVSSSLTTATKGKVYNIADSLSASNNVGTVTYTYSITDPDGSTTTNGTSWKPTKTGTYSITVNANDGGVIAGQNASQARTASTTFNVTVSEPTSDYKLAASWNDWSETTGDFFTSDGTNYVLVRDFADNEEFKVYRVSTDSHWYGLNPTTGNTYDITSSLIGTDLTLGNYKNIKWKNGAGKYKVTLTLDNDGVPDKIKFEELAYYVSGDTGLTGSNWGVDPATGKMTNSVDTLYTKTFKNVSAGTYEFRIADGVTYSTAYSDYALSGNANPTQGTTSTNNVKFTIGYTKADVTITFDSTQDSNNKYPVTVTVREVEEEDESGWYYSKDNSDATPEISGSTSGKFIYGTTSDNLSSNKDAYKSGNNYWGEFTSDIPTSGNLYVGLSSSTEGRDLYGTGSQQKINETLYKNSNNSYSEVTITKDGITLFQMRLQENGSVKGGVPFLSLYNFHSSVVGLGIVAVYSTSSNPVDYRVYYKLEGGSSDSHSVEVYAKDGAIRTYDSYGPYHTLARIASTELSNQVDREGTTTSISVTNHPYDASSDSDSAGQNYQTGTVKVGDIITVTTTIDNDHKDAYYVKGFVVNGKTPEIYNWNSTGVYTLNYEIKDDEFGLTDGRKLEITPVYFLKDDSNTVNFSIEGFTPDVQGDASVKKWGNTMYVYPFYANSVGNSITGRLNAFGSYPGQPLIYDGGKYYIQVPKSISYTENSVTATATVQGVTMSNGYWDHVHRAITGWPNENNDHKYHRQTYDYDDFYKISNELSPDNIIFEFKYETEYVNDVSISSPITDISAFQEQFTNGWEDLVDAHGRKIDVFGNVLSETEYTHNPPVYVVSKGYHVTNAGSYATEWEIFYPEDGTSTTKIVKAVSGSVSAINPSALALESSAKFAGYGNDNFSKYSGLYDVLNKTSTAKKHPVYITYESERLNSSGDIAYRSDGIWHHSKNNDIIHANIIIEYQQADKSYIADPFVDSSSNQGTNTGAKAYFTNEENNIAGQSYYGKTQTGDVYSNNKEFFTFAAEPSADYEFVEWKRLVNGVYYDISGDGSSPKTSIDTYVARFRPVKSGTLTVSHTLLQDATYKGSGTTEVKLEVVGSDSTEAASTYSTGFKTNQAQLTSKYIKANSSNYVRVTLRTTPNGEDRFQDFLYNGSNSASDPFFKTGNELTSSGVTTKICVFPISSLFETVDGDKNQVVSVLAYNSRLEKINFAYSIKYYFNGRLYGNAANSQWYVVNGNFTSSEFSNYVTKDGNDKYHISANFISSKRPYERDFMRDITWDFSTASAVAIPSPEAVGGVKTLTLDVYEAETTSDTVRSAIFRLPYCYNPGNNYLPNDYIPVAHREQRTNVQGGVYYVTTGYYYKPNDVVDGVSYSDYQVIEEDPGQTSKEFVAAKHDGIPVKDTNVSIPTFTIATNYGKRFTLDKPYNENDKASTYIEAAPSIWDSANSKELFFHYWKVTNLDGIEVTKCYYNKFNFSAYENYIIEPVYDDKGGAGQNITSGENEALGTTITFLDSSRNQWNEGGKGTNRDAAAATAGDVLFKDFAISYAYKSKVLNTYTDEDIKVGMVIERVGHLQTDSSGNVITNISTYTDLYKDGEDAAKLEIANRQKNGKKTTDDTHSFNDRKIASNCDESGYGLLSNTSLVDNKNRLRYYYGLYNSAGTTEYTNKNYVYRAYSYIAVRTKGAANWTNAQVEVSDPVYFTFYDIASK